MDKNIKWFAIIALLFVLGLVLPSIEFTPLTFINASNITTSGLGANSGNNLSLIAEMNNGYWQGNESTTPWYIDVNFTNITEFDYVEASSKYNSTVGAPTNHEVDIEIWCITENKFMDLASVTIHNEFVYFTRNFPDSEHFITSNGNVTIRFNHTDSGNTNHRIYIDVLRLAIRPQYEQVNATINYFNNTTTGAGCEGNCSFDGIWVNSIRKNNTSDAYANAINLSSPLEKKSGTITNQIDIMNGSNDITMTSSNTAPSSVAAFQVLYNQFHEGVTYNSMIGTIDLYSDKFTIKPGSTISGTTTYNFNNTTFDMGNTNITKVTTIYSNIDGQGGNVSVLNNSSTDSKKFIFFSENGTDRTYIQFSGVQLWKLKGSTGEAGYITYSTPGGFPGIVIYNSTFGNRIDIYMDGANGLRLRASSSGSAATNGISILTNGTIKIDTLAGAGNAYTCVDNIGQLYRGSPGC